MVNIEDTIYMKQKSFGVLSNFFGSETKKFENHFPIMIYYSVCIDLFKLTGNVCGQQYYFTFFFFFFSLLFPQVLTDSLFNVLNKQQRE